MLDYSVLMTVYKKDSPEYFIQSVSSMLNQTLKTNDFVLVCDGPITEELEQAITTVFTGHEDILNLVRLPQNVGLGQALHNGLPLCKNEWVARMDDDDISHLDRCEIELKFIEEHPGLSIVGSYVNEFEDNPRKPIRVKEVPTGEESILKYSKRRNPFNHSTVMIKKQDIIAAGNYSTMRTNQDVDTWVRVLNKGYKGSNIDQPLVDFRFDKNTYERRKEWKNIKLMIDVWKNFWKQGYCSFADYLFVASMQIAVFIMPNKLLEWAYDHLR
jgi:glycosyltransferase involved in cell wall biosynthesis